MKILDYKAKEFLRRNKEGGIIGAVAGALMAFYVRGSGLNFLGAASEPGLLDTIITAAPVDMAFYKMLIVYVFIGAAVGMFIDYVWKPGR